jgi:hypothetical protein
LKTDTGSFPFEYVDEVRVAAFKGFDLVASSIIVEKRSRKKTDPLGRTSSRW